ncbi:probetacellulin [Betta splendens]|uniref:Probetacellulin n=1 Tax=Betta splendens TaxID=158456 RepID=A0A6P7NVS3_BETSP|nr:probetacellulin [Betta splendens]
MDVYTLCVGILTALALCKHCLAEWNSTSGSANRTLAHCRHHGNGDNCTDQPGADSGNTHFSECPEELRHYCVHGDCRYVKEQEAPSCRCQSGYVGSRCEYVDLDWRIGDKRQIIIACVIAVLVVLILLVVLICVCSHRRCRLCRTRGRRRDGEPRNGTEKVSMMDAGAAHALNPDSSEPAHADAV